MRFGAFLFEVGGHLTGRRRKAMVRQVQCLCVCVVECVRACMALLEKGAPPTCSYTDPLCFIWSDKSLFDESISRMNDVTVGSIK